MCNVLGGNKKPGFISCVGDWKSSDHLACGKAKTLVIKAINVIKYISADDLSQTVVCEQKLSERVDQAKCWAHEPIRCASLTFLIFIKRNYFIRVWLLQIIYVSVIQLCRLTVCWSLWNDSTWNLSKLQTKARVWHFHFSIFCILVIPIQIFVVPIPVAIQIKKKFLLFILVII